MLENSFVAVQRMTCPVLADLAEESVLDRVPFGCAGRIVCHCYGQTVAVGKLVLQVVLPCASAITVAASAVREDSELSGMRVTLLGKS